MQNAQPEAAMPGTAPARPRRGSFVVRMALARVRVQQSPQALAMAGRMALALPVVQALLLVAVLNAPLWQGLLGLEGLVVGALASAQLKRGSADGKLVGYGIALLNAAALGAIGLALEGHLFWLTGMVVMLPMTWLVFSATAPGSVRKAVIAAALPLLLLAGACGFARWGIEASETQTDPEARLSQLDAAWLGLRLRGGTGTERALLRLRQSQAAFAAGQYTRAFVFAHDGAYDDHGNSRVPATAIGADLLDSLIRVKAQAFYNAAWDKQGDLWVPMGADPLPPELLDEASVKVKWGW